MLSRAVLLNLGRQCRNNLMSNRLPTYVFHRIKELGLLKNTRGNRAGYSVRKRLINSSRKIDSFVSNCCHYANSRPSRSPRGVVNTLHRNLITVSCTKPGPTPNKSTPKIMVINARSIVKTDDAPVLHAELQSKNVHDICIITETWLNSKVSPSLVYPDGYVIVRKDRKDYRM